jgi:hypothetical protein
MPVLTFRVEENPVPVQTVEEMSRVHFGKVPVLSYKLPKVTIQTFTQGKESARGSWLFAVFTL